MDSERNNTNSDGKTTKKRSRDGATLSTPSDSSVADLTRLIESTDDDGKKYEAGNDTRRDKGKTETAARRRGTYSVTSSTVPTKKIPTPMYYKRTREEALRHEHSIPNYEMFDLETGFMKEKYRRLRSPSPPSDTIVYEVGTGEPYKYLSGLSLMRIYPGSVGMYEMRKEALDAGVLPDHLIHEMTRFGEYSGAGKKCSVKLKQEKEKQADESTERTSLSNSPSMEKEGGSLQRVIPNVTSFRDTAGFSGSDVTPPQQERPSEAVTHPSDGQTDVCNCVVLVSAESIRTDIEKPDMADEDICGADYLTVQSPTLRYLRTGYRNYVENNISDGVHLLTSYTCRSPRLKLYNVYKSISCRNKKPLQSSTSEDPPGPDTARPGSSNVYDSFLRYSELLLQKSTAIIAQYLNVFSVLTDFNYTCLTPALKGGICNAMVVDKLWTFSPVRQVYLPSYRLLFGDSYTNFAISEIQKLNNRGVQIRYVRFLSTPNTILFTNRRALASKIGQGVVATTSEVAVSAQQAPHPTNIVGRQFFPKLRSNTSVEDVAEHGGSRESTCHAKPTRQHLDHGVSNDISTEAKNPTLIVFKHIMEENKPETLLCNIIVEVDLAHEIHYM